MTTTVRTLGRRHIDRAHREALARVYLGAYGDATLPESRLDADHFVGSTLDRHSRRAGFRLVVATTDGTVTGYGYGFTGRRGQFWSDWLTGAAPEDVVREWVGNHFELVDLVVHPDHRGGGISGLLHDQLVDGLPQEKALLATVPDGGPADRLYTGRGWQVLVPEIDGAKSLFGLDLRARSDR